MTLRSPLGWVLGHGSAGEGVGHWWVQRVTSVALLPLTLWFVVALLRSPLQSYDALRGWLGQPYVAVLTILLVFTLAWQSIEWAADQFRFAPYPASWLNDERWQDEMPPQASQKMVSAATATVFATLGIKL